jgi:exonuclease SbcD
VDCADAAVWLMPFFRPREAAGVIGPFEPMTFDGAVRAALRREALDPRRANGRVAHQFVTGGAGEADQSDSEAELTAVGGAERVDYRAFDGFDYVALGHLHKPQRIGREGVRYAGSLLKYSASEAHHVKNVVLGEVTRAGLRIELHPVAAPRDLRVVRGTLEALTRPETVAAGNPRRLPACDADDPLLRARTPRPRLRGLYPHIFRMEYAPPRARLPPVERAARSVPPGAVSAFYRFRTGREMDDAMAGYMDGVFDEARGEAER